MWKMQIENMETLCYHMKKFWIIILIVTVQPLIYYIRKLDSKLSVAAMQLVFTSFIDLSFFGWTVTINSKIDTS